MNRTLGPPEEAAGPDVSLDWLCRSFALELSLTGSAVALILGEHDPGDIAASDDAASALVDMQFSLGEGPSIDAHRSGRVVVAPELASDRRWPAFAAEASAAGAAAVFALPLRVGAARFGALSLHSERPGPLGEHRLADALVMAEVACEVTLRLQAQVPPGSLHQLLDQLAAKRSVVYQATGMILVQLDVGPEDAVAALRAAAYAAGRPVGEVAADVVARRLRLER